MSSPLRAKEEVFLDVGMIPGKANGRVGGAAEVAQRRLEPLMVAEWKVCGQEER